MSTELDKLRGAQRNYQQAKQEEAERVRRTERERQARIEREQQEKQRQIEIARANRENLMNEMKRFLTGKVMPFAVSVGIVAGWIYLVYLAVCFTTSLGIDSPWVFLIDFMVRYIGSLSIVAIPFLIFKLSDNNFVTLLIAVLALVLAVMSYAYIP